MSNPDASTNPIHSEFASDTDMTELIEMFVNEMPDRISSLSECLRVQRLTELQTLAHQLKGSGAGYGFEPISLVAEQLESSLKSHADLETITQEVDKLVDICRRAAI
jgi:histidine phosphotransfer protein HptB